jgi:hypothetical protein
VLDERVPGDPEQGLREILSQGTDALTVAGGEDDSLAGRALPVEHVVSVRVKGTGTS